MRAAVISSIGLSVAAKVVHPEPPLPMGWIKDAASLPGIEFRMSVKQAGHQELFRVAKRVSDPSDSEYGKYLTKAQIDAIVAPLPADVEKVLSWAQGGGCLASALDEVVTVRCSHGAAESLLETACRQVSHARFRQRTVRCGDFTLPEEVHAVTQAVYGLHGLPLPPQRRVLNLPDEPAKVTPAVLASTYKISGVTPTGSTKNRNAVAEFQGQTMTTKDLQTFCRKFLPSVSLSDCTVHKFVGDAGEGHTDQTEAALDIQYIKGVAPHILSEFWYFKNMDFCGDLKNWTQLILSTDDAPLVHSVSYGWQGNMTTLTGCKMANVNDVDADFAKLAAKGITIIFASGDSGAGYTPPRTHCMPPLGLQTDVEVQGTLMSTSMGDDSTECCEHASSLHGVKGWTWAPTHAETCAQQTILKGVVLEGFGFESSKVDSQEACCDYAKKVNKNMWSYNMQTQLCSTFSEVRGRSSNSSVVSGIGAELGQGTCKYYSAVTGTAPSPGAKSVASMKPPALHLYPSWPASSPWITSVGSTRFVDQKIGQPEMATDQFGSGGGFSDMFGAFDAQKDAISHYFSVAPQLPPANAFPKGGRGTPDVCALGEGFQVIINGEAQSVGGTSASAPSFAGVASLLNEARLAKGKPPMGNMNPWIYQNADAFTDITRGDNFRGRGPFVEPYGFNTTVGWDPVTGVGSPVFDKMLAAALKTPSTSDIVV